MNIRSLVLLVSVYYNLYVEREHPSSFRNLVDVARQDFPAASEVLLSFPDRWEFIDTVQHAGGQIYVAGFPIERSFSRREHFEGLPAEINVDLVFYRLYKFFQPWPIPQLLVEWNPRQGEGRVIGDRGFKLQLQPIGQAQAWFGVSHAVLWECYLSESRRFANWQETLVNLWDLVEKDIGAPKIFTAPHEPAFPEGYREFLTSLGYSADAEHSLWWSKQRDTTPRIVTSPSN